MRMFPFITKTWNPVVGCPHYCKYCWAKKLAETKLKKFYSSFLVPQLKVERLTQSFREGDFVFVCDMGDLWSKTVPFEWQRHVMGQIEGYPKTRFLLLTKNPNGYKKYFQKWGNFPENCVLGVTVETNRSTMEWSFAPCPETRFDNFKQVPHEQKMVSVEPIMDFDTLKFLNRILSVKPQFVAVGYDNYRNGLREPSLEKTLRLIERLEGAGIKIYRKTLRERLLEVSER